MPLSRNSVGTYPETSSPGNLPGNTRLAEPLWTDPGLKSGISVRKLMSTLKKKKKKKKKGAGGE